MMFLVLGAWLGIWMPDGCSFLPCSQGQLDRRSSVQDRPSLLRVPAELWGELPEQPLLQRYLVGAWGTSGVEDKAGANVWKLLIRTSHSFMPLLVSNPQYSDMGTRGKLSVSESKDP